MIGATSHFRVYAYAAPCDMRKSFNTLSGLVMAMGHAVISGDLFLFVSKNRKRAKVLYHDGTGLCLLAKRIDRNTFAPIWRRSELSACELDLFLQGSHVVAKTCLVPKRAPPETHLPDNAFV